MKIDIKNRIVLLVLGILLILFGFSIFIWSKTQNFLGSAGDEYSSYDRHYVLITEGSEEAFWQRVYESGLEAAKESGAYLERFGSTLSVSYSRNELLKMAEEASVDGIIVEASEDVETIRLIGEIVEQGIPVITVLGDCPGSVRQGYVGVNNYDIGLLYGDQAAKWIQEKGQQTVHIQMVFGGDGLDTSKNLVLLGIRESLEESLPDTYQVKVDAQPISQTGSFATEEYFNQLFLDGESLPDILICLDALATSCACQAAVDHNRVGDVEILGYYDSLDTLEAVEKQILAAVLSLNAEQMGAYSVQALDDYLETGYTNSYQAVAVEMIDRSTAGAYLREREEEP